MRPGQKGQALPPPAGVGKPESPSLADPGGHFDHDTRGGLRASWPSPWASLLRFANDSQKLKVPLMSGTEHTVL